MRRVTSFPTRERGLKRLGKIFLPDCGRSFPTRERGLKLYLKYRDRCVTIVVPYAGTWIETNVGFPIVACGGVVPYAGTWIETFVKGTLCPTATVSFPTRERGLKLY